MKFCESNILLHGTQQFRTKISCVHAIATITEYIRAAMEKKQLGQPCFIDSQQALDTLNYELLLQKREIFCFRGKNYRDRRQFVYHNRRTTSKRPNTTGSEFAPFLFLLYIIDLRTVIEENQKTFFC